MTPHQTASGTVSESPLVLTDIVTDAGVAGHSIVFTYTALALEPTAAFLRNLEPLVQGEPLAPGYIEQKLSRRFRLLGTQGLVGMALAGLDMALWDALARTHDTSLARLLGGMERPVKAYGAIGYDGVSGSAKVAEDWAKRGFRGVKAKIGYPTAAEDLEVIHAIRRAAGPEMAILVDYNQSLTPAEAVERLRAVDDEGLTWIEEPVLANDFQGHAQVAREIRTPIQAGENWWGDLELRHAIDAGASDFVMLDVMKAGGVSGWMRGAGDRRGARHPGLESPVAGDQRAVAVRDADGALAGILRLVEPDRRRADPHRERACGVRRRARDRRGVERKGDRALRGVSRLADFFELVVQVAVEGHFHVRAFREDRVRTVLGEDSGEPGGGARDAADTGAHARMSGGRSGNAADGSAHPRPDGHGPGVGAVTLARDLSFLAIYIAALRIAARKTGAEIARRTVGQSQRIETDVQFTLARRASRLLGAGDGPGNRTAARDHDSIFHRDGYRRFEIDAVAFARVLGVEAVDQAEQDPRAFADGQSRRRCGSGPRRQWCRFAHLRENAFAAIHHVPLGLRRTTVHLAGNVKGCAVLGEPPPVGNRDTAAIPMPPKC